MVARPGHRDVEQALALRRLLQLLVLPCAVEPGCLELVVAVLDAEVETVGERFVCRKCAGLVYESAERTSRGGAAGIRVDVWDRLVQRISGGVLRGREVVVTRAAEESADPA